MSDKNPTIPNLDWLAETQINGNHRRFFVCRLGQTGSTWLAKLINSHPEVLCLHEAILFKIHPKFSYSLEDQYDLIRWYCADTQHRAYSALGEIGSLDLNLAIKLPREIFTIGLLLRHPANQLFTRLGTAKEDLRVFEIDEKKLRIEYFLKEKFGIHASKYESEDRLFLRMAWMWKKKLEGSKDVDCILKVEEFNNLDYAQETLLKLTGVHYEPSFLERAIDKKENVRAKKVETPREAFNQFTPQQQEWYKLMVNELAEEIGYFI